MRIVIILTLSLLVAGLTAIASFGIANASRASDLVLQIWPTNGFAAARRADLLIAPYAMPGNSIPSSVAEDVSAYSKRAFVEEPFTPSAIRNLALIAERSGNDEDALILMSEVARLTRRDVAANIWQITELGKRNNIEEALHLFDMTMRGSRAAKDLFLPTIQSGLKDPAFINPLVDVLQQKPSWEHEFWKSIDQSKDSIANAGRVRSRLAKAGHQSSMELDQQLLNALISFDHFGVAEELYTALSKQDLKGVIVRNSNFAKAPDYSPFEWEILYGADFEARIMPDRNRLQITNIGNNDNKLIRQLVKLPQRKLKFVANLDHADTIGIGELYASVYCASNKSASGNTLKIELAGGTTERYFLNDEPSCNYFWLDINIRGNSLGTPNEFFINRVAITPA